jgi:hypothetical protein
VALDGEPSSERECRSRAESERESERERRKWRRLLHGPSKREDKVGQGTWSGGVDDGGGRFGGAQHYEHGHYSVTGSVVGGTGPVTGLGW